MYTISRYLVLKMIAWLCNDIDIAWLKHYYLYINLFLIYMYSLV